MLTEETTEKIGAVYEKLSRERGPFSVFALFSTKNKPGRWQLMAAGPWISVDRAEGRSIIIDELFAVLTPGEKVLLSSVIIPDENHPELHAINQAIVVVGSGRAIITGLVVNHVPIYEAVIYRLDLPNRRIGVPSVVHSPGRPLRRSGRFAGSLSPGKLR